MAPFPFFGETLAVCNALLWGFVVILFKICGKTHSPLSLNLFKIAVGLVFLFLTLIILHQPLILDLSFKQYALMAISGALGIGVSDTLFFKSLNILGASRAAIVDCLYSPFIILFSYFLLQETLNFIQSIGAILVFASLIVLATEKSTTDLPQKKQWEGIALGALSMAIMAFSIVIIKPMLSELSVVWVSAFRMLFGFLLLLITALLQNNPTSTFTIFKPSISWKLALPACFIGSYITMLLWIGSFKFTSTNTAGILTQLSVPMTVVFAAIILKEKMTPKKYLSLSLALMGSYLVMIK